MEYLARWEFVPLVYTPRCHHVICGKRQCSSRSIYHALLFLHWYANDYHTHFSSHCYVDYCHQTLE
jgi:hypothetical protein